MKKIPKSAYTSEFKAQAVKHAQAIGLSQASRELGVVEQTLRNWLKASAAGKIGQTSAPRVIPEQMELTRLRAENVRLQMHVEILKNGHRGATSSRWQETRVVPTLANARP